MRKAERTDQGRQPAAEVLNVDVTGAVEVTVISCG